MQSNNPVLGRAFGSQGSAYRTQTQTRTPTPSAQELEQMYQTTPAVERGAMTYDDVVAKTGIMFAVLVAGALVGWQVPSLTFVGLIVGLVLAMVNIFKKEPSPALMLAYAAFEGLFVGGISFMFENYAVAGGEPVNGIVSQAIIGTLGVFAIALWAYKSKRVRVTPKFQRGVLIAMGGYLVFVLVNLAYVWFFDGEGLGFRTGWLGVAIGLFAITLAALVLILNFDSIEKGVQSGIPAKFAWTAAFGLVVTLVWLYVEMLRLLAILQGE